MREILFRGKRIDNGKWVEGHYAHQRKSLTDNEAYYILTNGGFGFSWNTIDPATVGQYTGLTDKNGAKIFEGDIVRACLNPEICVGTVEFDERVSAFIIKLPKNKCTTFMDLYIAATDFPALIWTEVIGNIHDNPELAGGNGK